MSVIKLTKHLRPCSETQISVFSLPTKIHFWIQNQSPSFPSKAITLTSFMKTEKCQRIINGNNVTKCFSPRFEAIMDWKIHVM